MNPTERKQAIYALNRRAWAENYLKHTCADWQQVSDMFAAQSRSYIAVGELTLAAEAQKHSNTFASIARQCHETTPDAQHVFNLR